MRAMPALPVQPEKNMDTQDNAGEPASRGQRVPDTDLPGRKPSGNKTTPLSYADAQTLSRLAQTLSEEDRAIARKILRGG